MAKQLVGEKLAACVNIVPGLQSVYVWQGSMCLDEEVLLIIKSCSSSLERLESYIVENHPYETPEFVAFTATRVSERYAAWVTASLS